MKTTTTTRTLRPFKVRQSCGCIAERMMSESTAGVRWTPETILDNGSPECAPHRGDSIARARALAMRLVTNCLAKE